MKPTKPQYGYFLLADISGFSSYLMGVELEHADGILKKLLESIARKIKPVFRVQDFDVDSVFAFAPNLGSLDFEKLYGLVENAYSEFKNNLTDISDHITCNCAACRDVISLDLKFMVHHGEYILSNVQKRPVLHGLDPTFVRNRNWKDSVSASVSWRGYFLITEQCLVSLHMSTDKFQGKKFISNHFKMFGLELKNGGSQQVWCKDCGKRGVRQPRRGYTAEEKEQILAAYPECPSMRGIERSFGVSHHTLAAWLEKKTRRIHP